MAAVPLGYVMTCAFPKDIGQTWLAGFAAGLARDQVEFGITLLGGDTTATPGPPHLLGKPPSAASRPGASYGGQAPRQAT